MKELSKRDCTHGNELKGRGPVLLRGPRDMRVYPTSRAEFCMNSFFARLFISYMLRSLVTCPCCTTAIYSFAAKCYMDSATVSISAQVGKTRVHVVVPAHMPQEMVQSTLAAAIAATKAEQKSSSEDEEGEGEDIETTEDEQEEDETPLPEDEEFLEEHPDDVVADELEAAAELLEEDTLTEEEAVSVSSGGEEGEWPYPTLNDYDWDGPFPVFDAFGMIVKHAAAGKSEDGSDDVDADAPDVDPDFDVEEETAAEKAEREAEAARRQKERERAAKTKAGPPISIGAKLLNVKTGRKPARRVGPKAASKAAFLNKDKAPEPVDLCATPVRGADPGEPAAVSALVPPLPAAPPAAAPAAVPAAVPLEPFSSACCSSCAAAEAGSDAGTGAAPMNTSEPVVQV